MFSKQPKDKPSLDFDLRHLPKKRRDEIEETVTLGELVGGIRVIVDNPVPKIAMSL
jgi:hypothetical protein